MKNKNRIIVSGLSLLQDVVSPDEEDCFACDYDLGWMFQHPSTLIWADTIIVSPSIIKYIKKEVSSYGDSDSWGKIARIFFELADDLGIIEVKDPTGILSQKLFDVVEAHIEHVRNLLPKYFPDAVKAEQDGKTPRAFTIIDQHYCSPRVNAFYASLALSRIWNAQLLLNRRWEVYLKYCLGLQAPKDLDISSKLSAFDRVFSQYIPEMSIFPPEVYKQCRACDRITACDSENITRVEKQLKQYSELREYDEIHQLKKVFNSIIDRAHENLDPSEIESEFSNIQKRLRKQMRHVFPNISRWSKIVTMLSIPVIVSGVSSGDPLIGGTGAAIAGIAQTIEKYIEIFSSKNRWVYFKQIDE